MSAIPTQPAPAEDVNRGTVIALLTIPAGVIVWVIIWSIGFIASIVSFGVAYLAMFLYTRGSGGLISRAGAVRVTIITLVTVALSIYAGIVSDVALAIAQVAGVSPIDALSSPQFNELLSLYIAEGDWGFSVLIAIAFAILGCFGVLRSAFRSTASPAPTAPEAQQPWPQPSRQEEPPAA